MFASSHDDTEGSVLRLRKFYSKRPKGVAQLSEPLAHGYAFHQRLLDPAEGLA